MGQTLFQAKESNRGFVLVVCEAAIKGWPCHLASENHPVTSYLSIQLLWQARGLCKYQPICKKVPDCSGKAIIYIKLGKKKKKKE